MTGRTLNGARAVFLVAVDALTVERFRPRRRLALFIIFRIMTLAARLFDFRGLFRSTMAIATGPQGGIVVHWVVMAIIARKTVTRLHNMCFVIKQDIACNDLEHYPHWLFRSLGREGGISQDTNDKKNRAKPCE